MNLKILGAVMIVFGCGFSGFYAAAVFKAEERSLRQLLSALDHIQCELQYRLTPLPDLCRTVGEKNKNTIGRLLIGLAEKLEDRYCEDVHGCMDALLREFENLPEHTKYALQLMGSTLGRFDLDGQLQGLDAVRDHCRKLLEEMESSQDSRLRSYQTLGLCAGAALAIIFV